MLSSEEKSMLVLVAVILGMTVAIIFLNLGIGYSHGSL
jgi:hypothetical protein